MKLMSDLEKQAEKLKALGHPIRLRIIKLLTEEGADMYLNEIAKKLGMNRANTKIHLKNLENAGILKSRVVLVEGEAKALRFYKLLDFDIQVSPEKLKEVRENGN